MAAAAAQEPALVRASLSGCVVREPVSGPASAAWDDSAVAGVAPAVAPGAPEVGAEAAQRGGLALCFHRVPALPAETDLVDFAPGAVPDEPEPGEQAAVALPGALAPCSVEAAAEAPAGRAAADSSAPAAVAHSEAAVAAGVLPALAILRASAAAQGAGAILPDAPVPRWDAGREHDTGSVKAGTRRPAEAAHCLRLRTAPDSLRIDAHAGPAPAPARAAAHAARPFPGASASVARRPDRRYSSRDWW